MMIDLPEPMLCLGRRQDRESEHDEGAKFGAKIQL